MNRKIKGSFALAIFLVFFGCAVLGATINPVDNTEGYVRKDNDKTFFWSTTNLDTGHRGFAGDTLWYRGFLQFADINVIKHVEYATLKLFYETKEINGETCSFDLNSITDIGDTLNNVDWASATFEVVIEDWYDETQDSNITGDVTTAWNNAIDAGRTYLAFRIGLVDENTFNSTENDCKIDWCDTDETGNDCHDDGLWNPLIEYIPKEPDLNVNNPKLGDFFTYSTTTDGNSPIDFNVVYIDSNYVYADIYYSTFAGGVQNKIVKDLNLYYYGLVANQTADVNCSDNNFQVSQQCFLDFNFMSLGDGNYFIDVNVHTLASSPMDNDVNALGSSSTFLVDGNPPTIYSDANQSWQNTDANVVTTCSDSGADLNSIAINFNNIGFQFFTGVDRNWFIQSVDGNYALSFFCSDNLGLTNDQNTVYVSVDKTTPSLSIQSPNTDTTSPDTTFTFVFDVSDNFDGSSISCDYNVMVDGNIVAGYENKNVSESSQKCTITESLTVVSGQVIDVNVMPKDLVNDGNVIQSKSITYAPASPPSPPSPPGGGGGGGVERAGIGEFCVSDSGCEFGLACFNFTCVVEGADFNGVLVFPNEITSSPFQDVLPGYEIVLPDVMVANYSDDLYLISVSLECTEGELCAADWCSIEEEFELQPRGQKALKGVCKVPTSAEVGEIYSTQIVVMDKASGLKKGVSVIIPVKKGDYSEILSGFGYAGGQVFQFFELGVICFGSQANCLLVVGNKPLDLGIEQVDRINVPFFVLLVSVFVFLASLLFGNKVLATLSAIAAIVFFIAYLVGVFLF